MLAAGTLVYVAAIDFTNRSSSIVPSIGMPSNVYELSRNDVSHIHTQVCLYIHTQAYIHIHTYTQTATYMQFNLSNTICYHCLCIYA